MVKKILKIGESFFYIFIWWCMHIDELNFQWQVVFSVVALLINLLLKNQTMLEQYD